MDGAQIRRYRTREFAELAGVTVRALHHYDRLGLLRPRRRHNGYRSYCEQDLVRLEQIVALKFVGIPLRRIKSLLDRDAPVLAQALRLQRTVLEAKRNLLDEAIAAIRQAEAAAGPGKRPPADLLKKIIEVIEMQNDANWIMKYYTGAARTKLAERRPLWSPELQERVSREWQELIAEVEAASTEDPAGPKGQALAGRWIGLIEEFTGGDPDIANAMKSLYTDKAHWPGEFQKQAEPFRVSPQAWAFIDKAIAERKQRPQ